MINISFPWLICVPRNDVTAAVSSDIWVIVNSILSWPFFLKTCFILYYLIETYLVLKWSSWFYWPWSIQSNFRTCLFIQKLLSLDHKSVIWQTHGTLVFFVWVSTWPSAISATGTASSIPVTCYLCVASWLKAISLLT